MNVRVLIYSSTPRDQLGGVQAVYARVVRGLRQQGHSVVEAWANPSANGSADEEVYPLLRLVFGKGCFGPRALKRFIRNVLKLLRGLLRHRPQVVNIHFVRRESAYFLLFKRLLGYKVVLSAHGSDVLVPTPTNAQILPHLLPRADAITAVTQPIADSILEYPGVDPEKVHVIPNGVDHEFWMSSSDVDVPARKDGHRTIVAVGRLTAVKGHDVLIKGFALLRNEMPDARLVVAGDGQELADLETLARELRVDHSVDFAGFIDRDGVRSLLHRADAFVLPSRSEGMPLALLEAMSVGVPTVATQVGGVPEVVRPGSGILVPPENPVALAKALRRVLNDRRLACALRRRARARARRFPLSVPERAYANLFVDLVNGEQKA